MPEATVLKVALMPEHFVWLLKAVAEVGVLIVKVALFVTDPQAPETSTLYVPAFVATRLVIASELFVWPAITEPFFLQTKLNGALPEGIVLKKAFSPGQFVRLIKTAVVVLLFTVSVA